LLHAMSYFQMSSHSICEMRAVAIFVLRLPSQNTAAPSKPK